MGETELQIWVLRESASSDVDIVGYGVRAADGDIGSVDEATWDVHSGRIVVDTGPWILGHKVILPAGLIERIDPESETVLVACTQEQVRNAPRYEDENLDEDERYWHSLRRYWGAPSPSGPAVPPEDRATH